LRRKILSLAALALCFALQGMAQTPPPHSGPPPILKLLAPHRHPPPASADRPRTPAVILDASGLGSPMKLEKGWRVGITADAAASLPEFDDAQWAIRDATDGFADIPDEDHSSDPSENGKPAEGGHPEHGHGKPFVWFRLHIKLAENHGPLALLIELPISLHTSMLPSDSGPGVDVFANGKQLKPNGPHADLPQRYQQISRIYSLDIPDSATDLTLVLRTIYIPVGFGAPTSFFNGRKLRLGHPDDLDRLLEIWGTHRLFERLATVVNSILVLVLALFLLALYSTQRGHVEYLWLALHELVQAPLGFVELAGASARIDTLWYAAIMLQLALIAAYSYFEFLIAFLSLKRRWYIKGLRYSSPLLLGIGPTLLMVGHNHVVGVLLLTLSMFCLLWIIGWLLFVFITLIIATARRNFEAGLLLIPLVLTMVGLFEPLLTAGMSAMGSGEYRSPLTFQAGPIPIHFAAIADFAGILAIVIIIFVRFLRVQRDQERVSSELAAARSVQELMIPQEKIQTPGFEVDSIYNPANEVGGDFFHVQPTEDGGLLVVLGDVAGKGLKAAMNVSMLMGALRRIPERSPARILESLNRVLTGSESFTTCQAAWFAANGEVVLANAGHLPPFLNSQEVVVPGGLPLGVLDNITYEEVRLYLHPGDRLLIMSDGVVEARQPSGELFGFERVHNLTGQSAFYIADAAKEFGQEDDITILTIRRLAQAMAA